MTAERALPSGAVRIVVPRSRWDWAPGTWTPFIGQRIPFPWPDGSSRVGTLLSFVEGAKATEFWFGEIGPDVEEE